MGRRPGVSRPVSALGQHDPDYVDAYYLMGVGDPAALVEAVRTSLDGDNKATDDTVPAVLTLVASIAKGAHSIEK